MRIPRSNLPSEVFVGGRDARGLALALHSGGCGRARRRRTTAARCTEGAIEDCCAAAILAVFGVPAYLIKRIMDLKERKLELTAVENKQLQAHNEDRKLLVARLEALEAIVQDGDFELNQQIKLVAKAEEKKRLAAGASSTQ